MQEVEKQQALSQTQISIEQAKSQFEIQRMQSDATIKRELMAQEFQYDMKLKQMDIEVNQGKEKAIEDRKDQRTKIQATQQSQMINQRQSGGVPTDFEAPSTEDLTGFSI